MAETAVTCLNAERGLLGCQSYMLLHILSCDLCPSTLLFTSLAVILLRVSPSNSEPVSLSTTARYSGEQFVPVLGRGWPGAINFSVVAQDLRADGSEASDSKGEWISSVTMDFDRRGVGQVVAARGALGVDGILAIKTCS